jgi:hypothetical protein
MRFCWSHLGRVPRRRIVGAHVEHDLALMRPSVTTMC